MSRSRVQTAVGTKVSLVEHCAPTYTRFGTGIAEQAQRYCRTLHSHLFYRLFNHMSFHTNLSSPGDYFSFSSIPDGRRLSLTRSPSFPHNSPQSSFVEDQSPILPFSSIWNVVSTNGRHQPPPRICQTVIYLPKENSILSCYGMLNEESSFSDEFWIFSIDKQVWKKMDVENAYPRANCGATYDSIQNRVWFFGGVTSMKMTTDLHYLDLNNLTINYPMTTGDCPSPCTLPMVVSYENLLIIWASNSGGADGTVSLSSLHVLNTDDMNWQKIETDYIGRQGSCGAIVDSTLYIFGATCSKSILEMDLRNFTFTLTPTTGCEPPVDMNSLATVSSGNVIFAFETLEFKEKTHLFVFDTEKANWMRFNVNLGEEKETDKKYPRIVFYLPNERKLIALCEGDEENTHPLTELNIGKSIAVLNQKLDYLSML